MLVSEILGTLTTSESMYKYLTIYQKHLRVFGTDEGEARVYCVPRRTTQFFSVRVFSRTDLGAPLGIYGGTPRTECAGAVVGRRVAFDVCVVHRAQ